MSVAESDDIKILKYFELRLRIFDNNLESVPEGLWDKMLFVCFCFNPQANYHLQMYVTVGSIFVCFCRETFLVILRRFVEPRDGISSYYNLSFEGSLTQYYKWVSNLAEH